jgi:integrase
VRRGFGQDRPTSFSYAPLPLVVAYDEHERTWNPPLPLLFQRRYRGENRPLNTVAIRHLPGQAIADSGLTDAAGRPLHYTPHDFRRMFITDAILNGVPPHIAQIIAGHRDLQTTMGYKAIYPTEVISEHRAFIARRRSARPGTFTGPPAGTANGPFTACSPEVIMTSERPRH